MARKYCERCGNAQKMNSIQKTESYEILHDVVEAETELLVCAKCGQILSRRAADEETLRNAYRKKHKLLYPREIREIREQYQLSVNLFARLVHWSDKTLRKYESGAIPTFVHNSLLRFLKNPENMKVYIENNEHHVSARRIRKLLKRLDEMTLSVPSHGSVLHRFFSDIPSEANGYKGFDYHLACGMVMFFSTREKDIPRMKLMSLLYYADMLYYQRYSCSMSGIRYVHRPYGAIAENTDILFGIMEDDGLIRSEVKYTRKNEHHVVSCKCDFPEGMLSDTQEDVLFQVYQRFSEMDAKQVLKCVRKEKNFQRVKDGAFISYENALKMLWN